jgi:hypothetical protein
MTLPPELPFHRRFAVFIVLLLILVAAGFAAGLLPVLKRWFGEWKASAG